MGMSFKTQMINFVLYLIAWYKKKKYMFKHRVSYLSKYLLSTSTSILHEKPNLHFTVDSHSSAFITKPSNFPAELCKCSQILWFLYCSNYTYSVMLHTRRLASIHFAQGRWQITPWANRQFARHLETVPANNIGILLRQCNPHSPPALYRPPESGTLAQHSNITSKRIAIPWWRRQGPDCSSILQRKLHHP